jgi:CTP synthase (UTP-ammonia lyase)
MRLGSYDARLHADSVVGKLYQRIRNSRVEDGMIGISERHRHRYEVNPEYVAQLQSA